MPNPAVEALVRSVHPDKVFYYLPGLTTANIAALYGLDEAGYGEIRVRFADEARQSAEHLLSEPGFADAVDRLPFAAGATVAVIGESTTDALGSWLDIFDHVLRLSRPVRPDRPGRLVNLVNAAITGYPTTQCLRILSETLLRHRPEWVLLFVGANDALRYGYGAGKPLVDLAETTGNLAEMRRLLTSAGARPVWMTPTSVDAGRAAQFPPFQAQRIWLREEDLAAVADAIRDLARHGDPVVDVEAAFGRPASPDLLGPDGVHPSRLGQRVIANAVVRTLAS